MFAATTPAFHLQRAPTRWPCGLKSLEEGCLKRACGRPRFDWLSVLDFDLEQSRPQFSAYENAFALRVISDAVKHGFRISPHFRRQYAFQIQKRTGAPAVRVNAKNQIAVPHVRPDFSLDELQLVQVLDGPPV